MNSCVIIGRVLEEPKKNETLKKNQYQLLIESARPFYEEDGTIKKDIFLIRLWKGLAEKCSDICHTGDILAIKGRMESECNESGEARIYSTQIIAEKITFVPQNGKGSGIMY